jgi:two-component system response regulator HydG
LLRIVQEQRMKRIGGVQEMQLDVRILVASNENLLDSHRKGKFREDLYHRFNEFSISVPPLRERQVDIMIFAEHFLNGANQELNKKISSFDDDVIKCFKSYSWPGNIREMKNVIKRAALLCDEEIIRSKFLPVEISNPDKFIQPENNATRSSNSGTDLKGAAQEAEYETIVKVLRQVNYNKSEAARLLNIDRKTLYNKMKAYNL